MRTRRPTTLLAALVLTGGALAGCGGSTGSGGKEIRIGLIFPTTGAMAALGTDQGNAARMMLDQVNADGGIDGTKIKIFEGDSQSDPSTGATVAQRMIDTNQVQIIIGSYASGIAQAVAPVAQRNRVVLWEVGAVSPTVAQKGNDYFVRTVGTSDTFAAADLAFLRDHLAPELGKSVSELRVAVANEDGPFGTTVADAIEAQAKAAGVNVVTREQYAETSGDLTPVVLRLKAAKPDVVLIAPLVASAPLFWKAARTQNLQIDAIIGSAGFSSSVFVDTFKAKGVEGVYDVEPPAVAQMSTEHLAKDAATTLSELGAKFEKEYGHPCLVHCGDGLGGAYILVKDVLPRALESGDISGTSVRDAARKTDIADGGTPQGFGAKFTDAGENERAKSYIMQWQDGVLRVVYPTDRAEAKPVAMPAWSAR